jgi:hypothetical protein
MKQDESYVNLYSLLQEYAGSYERAHEVVGKGNMIPDQTDTGLIFVRQCYIDFYDKILAEGQKGPVLVCDVSFAV